MPYTTRLTPAAPPSDPAPSADPEPTVGEFDNVTGDTLDFPVVGIGASAGGLPAILRLLENMPPTTGMAFVVVLHLSPTHESSAAEILQRVTPMPTCQVTGSTPLEPDHIYVIPPSRMLRMIDAHLEVTSESRPEERRVAIDVFFRTLGDVHGPRAIGIVLSGTGADGSLGLQRVKERGGFVIAQDPDDAQYDAMPRNAISTALVDIVLPVADIPAKLVDLWARMRERLGAYNDTGRREEKDEGHTDTDSETNEDARRNEAVAADGVTDYGAAARHGRAERSEQARGGHGAPGERDAIDEAALRAVMAQLHARTGHDFAHYKRATVQRRIGRRLQVNGLPNIRSYQDFFNRHPAETAALLKDLLISVTHFFRDQTAFEALETSVIDPIFKGRETADPVRVWVAACATGEEAYSIAMLLCERVELTQEHIDIQVFASDIDEPAIARARAGIYPAAIALDLAPQRLRQFFKREDDNYRLNKALREKVLFAPHNVLRDPPFSHVDLICCRNLLIYLERDVQRMVLEMFHFALKPGGYLFLGSSESAEAVGDLFAVVDKKHRIYRSVPTRRLRHHVPSSMMHRFHGIVPARSEKSADRRGSSYADLHQQLLSQYAPPSVLVDADCNIVHISEHANRFLCHVSGVPTMNLLALIHPDLRLDLRTALFQAVKTKSSVDARKLGFTVDGRTDNVNITARPVERLGVDFVLVLFDQVEASIHTEHSIAISNEAMISHMDAEMQRLKEQLQETIEDAESSGEELRASNQELQAANEELRSASEELETSKEELQSINEELITVNGELRSKVEETGKINDDLQNLIASTDIATVFVAGDMTVKRFTPRALALFSLIPTDVGRSLLDITHRLEYPELVEDVRHAFESLRTIEREVKGPAGTAFAARVLPYRTTDDRIEGAVLTFVDISHLRQAEARVKETEARMRLVAQSTRDYAIITMDPTGKVLTWNRGAGKIFGYSEAEAVGEPASMVYQDEDRESGVFLAELNKAAAVGRVEEERWYIRKDGSLVYCSGVVLPLESDDGHFIGFAKITRDETERQKLDKYRAQRLSREKEVRHAAQAANQLKDEFLAIMSHELKHPLNLISINADLLSRMPTVRGQGLAVRSLEAIGSAVMSQAKIIDDLLDLSRMNTGKLTLNRVPMDLVGCIRNIITMADEAARSKRIDLRFATDQSVINVLGDPVRLEQIVWNLLNNAFKFTPSDGQVAIRLTTAAAEVCVEVEDSGAGVEPSFVPFLFDMFRQQNPLSTRHDSGLGIGLALVKELVTAHGGRVAAHSEGVGKGTCFSVWLPSYQALTDVAALDRPTQMSLKDLRVLLVDDAAEPLAALAALLELEGALPVTASNAHAAMALLEAEHFDLLISDIAMPEMDGYELIAAVRSAAASHLSPAREQTRLPAIALTGFGRHSDEQKALSAGFDAHVGKPVSLDRLQRVVAALVRRD